MKELLFPFNSNFLLRNIKKLRRELLSDGSVRIQKKIAVLGGSTTNHIAALLELFLLNYGIEPTFYQSEYSRFYEDAVFGSPEFDSFAPDIIFIHTTSRNLRYIPDSAGTTADEVQQRTDEQMSFFHQVWESLDKRFDCPIIQNNFELPLFRQTGNYDCWGFGGQSAFINRINVLFSDYAAKHRNFFINDINYLSAAVGLENWHNAEDWYLYKYAMGISVIPDLAYSVANIIKSVFGRNRKAISLDLDNTLWGGVVSEDGQEGIVLGSETAAGMAFREFQHFLRGYRDYGILLTVCSKNDEENALLGLNHPESLLKPDDFVSIKANWESKDSNLIASAEKLSLLTDSFVFIDDNPAECAIVEAQLPETAVINMTSVRDTMYTLSRSGFFEVTALSEDDLKRNEMYAANAGRKAQMKSFASYTDYLISLEMVGYIGDFQPVQLDRITQLTNKSNQFNLTTRRYTEADIRTIYESSEYIRLCGRLCDKFGDNGIVSVVIGHCDGDRLSIELWLMSCRVLKRDMELAMLDELVKAAKSRGIKTLVGFYFKTPKNNMVSELYKNFGFECISLSDNGDSVWELDISSYTPKNHVISVKSE